MLSRCLNLISGICSDGGVAAARGSVLALLAAGALAGCALERAASDQALEVEARLAESRDLGRGLDLARVRLVRGPYIGIERASVPPLPLPAPLLEPDGVTLPLDEAPDDSILAARIEEATGLRVALVGTVPPKGEGDRDGLEADPPRLDLDADHLSADGELWTGPLDRLLDAWTEPRGYSWRHDRPSLSGPSAIEVVRHRTLLFRLHALAGTEDYNASISTSGAAAGSGSSAASSQSTSATLQYDLWAGMAEQVKALLGPSGTVTPAPSSGSILVSGLPGDLRRVRSYLEHLNREVLRPVTVTISVYSLRLAEETELNLGVTALLRNVLGAHHLTVSGESVSVVRPSSGSDSLLATVGALSALGQVTRRLSATLPTVNGKPTQFFELFDRAYLERSSTTIVDGTQQTQLEPGTASSGFAFSYLPRLLAPDQVLLRLFASVADRPEFRTFESGSPGLPGYARIELPEAARRAVQVTQALRRGETLLVTGFRDGAAESDRAGSLTPHVPVPSGRRRTQVSRTETLLLVQAAVGAPLGLGVSAVGVPAL